MSASGIRFTPKADERDHQIQNAETDQYPFHPHSEPPASSALTKTSIGWHVR